MFVSTSENPIHQTISPGNDALARLLAFFRGLSAGFVVFLSA
jgi:hypothetical protein